MKDIQSEKDTRGVYLNEVGIRALKMPIKIIGKYGEVSTVATADLAVDLPTEVKGTHMSRFVIIMQKQSVLNPNDMKDLLKELSEKLKADKAFVKVSFPYFIEKSAPATGMKSINDLDCTVKASIDKTAENGKEFSYELLLEVPVMTLCPCSKAISDYGAHNQRSIARVHLTCEKPVWIEDLVSLIEKNASCELYAVLKRPDEKFVTEKSYDNPKFVEDVARDIYCDLEKDKNILDFEVEVESIESIHNHNAYARAKKRN